MSTRRSLSTSLLTSLIKPDRTLSASEYSLLSIKRDASLASTRCRRKVRFSGKSEDQMCLILCLIFLAKKILFLVSKASLQTWHKRLGHPHSTVLKTIVTSNKLPRGVVDTDEEGVKGSLVALPRIQSVQWGLEKLVDIECCSFLSLISYDTFH
ncbi:hypothetical protein PRUPE_2G053000 [Prunus persica]|uniref:Uncharacterized protein n=1 Tax=Prunus persica TaxID=3760 RepID=A0A251QBK8_PRUPE|nr:hypothetical protein PRUPE_2G053000 [Prunus persica]